MAETKISHKISIIIPVYNVEKYLRQCLDSVINQTYKNLEIIIVDDGSTDNSGKICDEYADKDKRIILIHQDNKDLSAARNLGLKIATGEYVGYVDSDDYVELDMYEKLYNGITTSEADLVVCNRVIGQKNGKWKKNINFPHKKLLTSNEALESFYGSMYVRNKLYKRSVIEGVEFIESYAEDVWYNFRILTKVKKIICIDDYLNYYRYNPRSRLNTKKFKKSWLSYIDFLNLEIEYCENNNLHNLKKRIINSKTSIASARLYYLSFENHPDEHITKPLIKIVKEHIFQYLLSDVSITKKFFAITVCVNFSIAKNISRFIKTN